MFEYINFLQVNIDKPKYQSLADILFEEADNAAAADAAAAEGATEAASAKKVPSLEDLENMDTEDDEENSEEQEAARILSEILEDEDAEEGTH